MPIFSVYAKIGKRNTRKVILTIFESPCDWSDLKETLHTAARHIWQNEEQEITEVTLERHLPGRYIRGTTSYRESRIRFKREFEFKARLTYQPKTDKLKVECAVFAGPVVWDFREAYYTERGRKWKPTPLIPAGFIANLLNPETMYIDLLRMKTPTFAAQPKNMYASRQEKHHQQGMYAAASHGSYAARNATTVIQDKEEKENEV